MLSFRIAIFTISSLALVSCAVGPNFHRPASPATPSYTASPLPKKTASVKGQGGAAQQFEMYKDIPAQWWALFQSEDLNELIQQGLANSPNLAAAQAALREAHDNLWAGIGAGLFPLITGQFNAQREQFSGNTFGQPGTNLFNLYNAQVNVSYTLDVFGGIRRQIEALGAQEDYERFELAATYLSLTANIVTTAIAQAQLRAQISATYELIQSQEESLRIINGQFQLGGVARTDVLAQQTLLAQTYATLPPLEKSLAQTRHALAVLVGRLPSDDQLPVFDLSQLKLPTHLPISLPSRLVAQRPDVRAAEALMHAASAQIGVATANLLPQFTLNGYYGATANQLKDLFKHSSEIWDIEGQVMQTIFNGGALLAKRRAAIDAYQQAAAQYRETVLQAFQNVADALRALQYDAIALRAQTQAESSARGTLRLTRQQFKLGAVNYLSLLNAEIQYQQTRIARVQAEAQRFTDTAALFQALGGGWWNNPGAVAT
ncbi:MAG TPA: efflux transporter outer membrane subunit [Gammaproteobacteria bacterium]|nr:efflux transporter outer membrane subunit [Gammaproteobacteria bacterium]